MIILSKQSYQPIVHYNEKKGERAASNIWRSLEAKELEYLYIFLDEIGS